MLAAPFVDANQVSKQSPNDFVVGFQRRRHSQIAGRIALQLGRFAA